jgi:UDPglucose 6-dehydrogenase
MRMTVIGVGYVGLVTGTCFAESGNEVTCIDIDQKKIERLRRGELPIYEPGLQEMVRRNCDQGRLHFCTDLAAALDGSSVVFIAVGTPQSESGASDLGALWAVARSIRGQARQGLLVVVKSTVPVGTNRELEERLNRGSALRFETASNPEFLKEGHAIEDFQRPDRVVVGVRSPEATRLLHALYAPFLRSGRPFLVMSPESAEMTKYVANALLATKISFINEMANFCERCGADVNDVRQGIGHDNRIGFQFLFPGPGYGGSCFPKDVRSLIAQVEKGGGTSTLLRAVDAVNERQKTLLLE